METQVLCCPSGSVIGPLGLSITPVKSAAQGRTLFAGFQEQRRHKGVTSISSQWITTDVVIEARSPGRSSEDSEDEEGAGAGHEFGEFSTESGVIKATWDAEIEFKTSAGQTLDAG
ncbi:hypothetical protein JOB18_011424 [Solea senegalensis]|uniref:Uncharacterized protein n=1 Tax=Solea senegalensis TaxID=28829 RepID=A0AAV6SKH1_SOLSE|nr:hypothetical protein JOB18_011424 [Solea senegalensis]